MKAPSSIQYSGKSLKALQEVLKLHQSFIWHNPVTSTMAVKRLAPARVQNGNDISGEMSYQD